MNYNSTVNTLINEIFTGTFTDPIYNCTFYIVSDDFEGQNTILFINKTHTLTKNNLKRI